MMYLLGYIPKDNRLYLGDKELNVVSYSLLLSVLEYQTAVMRRDFDTADKVLPTIPREQRSRVAHFLEKQVWSINSVTGVRIFRDFLSSKFILFIIMFSTSSFSTFRVFYINCLVIL